MSLPTDSSDLSLVNIFQPTNPGWVAQWLERSSHKRQVVGSIPTPATSTLMGREHHKHGRKSHDQYAREALGPVRRSLLTLYRAIEYHSGKRGLTAFIIEYGGAYGLTPDNVYSGRVTRIDLDFLEQLIVIARENGYIEDAFSALEES